MISDFIDDIKKKSNIELIETKRDVIKKISKTLKHDEDIIKLLMNSICDITFTLSNGSERRSTICTLNAYFIAVYLKYIQKSSATINVDHLIKRKPGIKSVLFFDLVDNKVKSMKLNSDWVVNDFMLFSEDNILAMNNFIKTLSGKPLPTGVKTEFKKHHV